MYNGYNEYTTCIHEAYSGLILTEEVKQFKNLEEINIYSTGMNVLPDLSCLTKLKNISIRESWLTKIPEWLGNLSNLEILNISECDIKDISYNFNKLQKLKELIFDDIRTTIDLFYIVKIKNLEKLNLSYNDIIHIDIMCELHNLRYLSFSSCNIKYIPNKINKLVHLIVINFNNNHIENIPNNLYKLTNLKFLNLERNNIDYIPVNILNLNNLTHINILYNPIINNLQNIHALVIGFLHRTHGLDYEQNNIYNNKQNIHASSIQKSTRQSIINILSYKI